MTAVASTDILDVEQFLVSPVSGVVRKLDRVYKDVTEPAVPFIWRAEVANHRFLAGDEHKSVIGAGKGLNPAAAKRGALGEAVERYCGLRPPPASCPLCARRDLEGPVLEPELLVLHTDEQLQGLPYARYTPDLAIEWIRATRLDDNVACWVPAHAAYLVPPASSPAFFQATSNGLAAGGDAQGAALGALLELVERDSFLCAWYHRLPVQPIALEAHPDARLRAIVDAYRRRGVAIEAYRLPADHSIPAVAALAIGKDAEDPAVVVGLGAGLTTAAAVRSAVMEVGQVRPAIKMKLRDPKVIERRAALVADPRNVSELEDHDLLYTDPRMLGAFDMWRSSAAKPLVIEDDGPPPDDPVGWVTGEVMKVGARSYLYDMTTSDIAPLGLRVARAFIEDFQPVHFGDREFRKAGKRFYDMPRRLGFDTRARGEDQLNPLPHPLS